ncbi:SAM-dependent methyltransferase [Oceanidesulfovibrio indonesiensis]|uniref:SAM-dependent methyltransferase n=1 Tax=Oceanidesulfovibrio indonesiensis TaxID=54767 RepID=A0A7M3MD17_9BACT|nr:methyltransferase [Oceanidesulfovibrio indonesiensis]TVM15998.1 SAM-dependent methyltransferase [Oceanidesulfovibrio indonesiensis]
MQEWNAGALLGVSGFYWRSCALHAGVKLDVFTAIGEKAMQPEDVAARIRADPDATSRLLGALAAMNLLRKVSGAFSNTEISSRHLSRDSEEYLGFMILHHHYLMESWNRLDQAVESGGPVGERAAANEDTREAFLMGMFNNAMLQAPGLVQRIDLDGRRTLLDMGGGPGTYAIQFCLQNPELSATVYDLPTTRPFAEKTITRFGLSDRIRFEAGNYLADPLPSSFDVVWMSHILHSEGFDACREMIRKAAESLQPGGLLLVHDFYLNDDKDGPVQPALFSLNMLVRTQDGRSYSEAEVREMLEEAGLENVRRLDYDSPTESGVLTATRPA